MNASTRIAVATHALALMAQAGDGIVGSVHIAGSVNTNPVVIRRVLGSLRRAGLVASQPGAGGGWTLARPPGDITLREVYRAIDEPPLLRTHRDPNPRCPVGRNIQGVLEGIFGEAEAALENKLAGVTVAQMLADVLGSESARPGEKEVQSAEG